MRNAPDEVSLFRKMLEELEANGMKEVVTWACMGLGVNQKRTGKPWSDDVPLGELYEPYCIDQLCDRVLELVEKEGVLSAIVIGGLLNHLVEMFEFMGDPNRVSSSIDNSIGTLEDLQRMRSLPLDARPNGIFTDEALDGMIEQVKESFPRTRPRQEKCEQLAEALRSQWNEKFPASYFHEGMFNEKQS